MEAWRHVKLTGTNRSKGLKHALMRMDKPGPLPPVGRAVPGTDGDRVKVSEFMRKTEERRHARRSIAVADDFVIAFKSPAPGAVPAGTRRILDPAVWNPGGP